MVGATVLSDVFLPCHVIESRYLTFCHAKWLSSPFHSTPTTVLGWKLPVHPPSTCYLASARLLRGFLVCYELRLLVTGSLDCFIFHFEQHIERHFIDRCALVEHYQSGHGLCTKAWYWFIDRHDVGIAYSRLGGRSLCHCGIPRNYAAWPSFTWCTIAREQVMKTGLERQWKSNIGVLFLYCFAMTERLWAMNERWCWNLIMRARSHQNSEVAMALRAQSKGQGWTGCTELKLMIFVSFEISIVRNLHPQLWTTVWSEPINDFQKMKWEMLSAIKLNIVASQPKKQQSMCDL